jgi:hypothetical protein
MNAIAEEVTWDPFGGTTTTPATVPVHRPAMVWENFRSRFFTPMPTGNTFKEFDAVTWTPPFWVQEDRVTLNRRSGKYPGCPPMEAGQKALSIDDLYVPRVVEVVEIREGYLMAKYGDTVLQVRAWVALTDSATLTPGPRSPGNPDGALSEEEAAAVDAEFEAWSRFLGARAEKYNWCGTFENILNGVGVKPWRPGFKTVTLQVDVAIEPDEALLKVLSAQAGGEIKPATARMQTHIVLKDVSREDFNGSRWKDLLSAAGYKNFSNIYVLEKEVETA